MRTPFVSLVVVAVAAPVLHAQTPADARFPVLPPPVEAGIDSVFLDLDHTDSPGCAAGVVIDGMVAFADGWGSANLDHELPITPETVFYMGSVSKQFTAAAVALAARQGHLSLDDDVRTWFPELPDYGDTIRVRHLIHHTSGIRDYLTLLGFAGTYEGASDEQIIRLLARQRALNFPPGERELYSNSGYFLLSELIERATGMTLPEYARREFFGPLGMRNSHFHDDPNHIVRYRATGYEPVDGGFRMNHAWAFSQVGSGGLYSNVEDMARWEAAFAEDRIGPPGLRDALLQPGVLESGDTLDYAFGLSLAEYRGVPMIAHGGSLAGFRAAIARFPEQQTAVVVFCNVADADPSRRLLQVADLVLGDRLGPRTARSQPSPPEEPDRPAPELPRAELEAYAGRYRSAEVDPQLVVAVAEGGLAMGAPGRRARVMRAVPGERDAFAGGGVTVRFRRGEGGRVEGFVLDAGRANGIVFERVGGGR